MITMSALSTQYVQVPIDTTFNGTPYNPTADAVAMAFMPSPPGAAPGTSDWKTGRWATLAPASWAARCLVGPATGGVALAVGVYTIWVQITDNPEIPTASVGLLQIT
jgi:hypothetical protein